MGTEDVKIKTSPKVGVTSFEPSMWKVIFHNDEILFIFFDQESF